INDSYATTKAALSEALDALKPLAVHAGAIEEGVPDHVTFLVRLGTLRRAAEVLAKYRGGEEATNEPA
ncbi:MAG: hypothetical protein KGL39_45910, partial [Patescibacteria group bacterium]|nr:hypothetical protein [Patescibacteria group bacterium]